MLSSKSKIILTTGLALFAMFFGAGNLVFPLAIGAHAGQHFFVAWVGFMVAGVCLPFLGLFAVSLFHGDYWRFFSILGKHLAFIVVFFLILIIGPLFAAPRTANITYGSIQPFLPHGFTPAVFSAIYFGIILLLSYKHTMVIDIIGRFISPVKVVAFVTLIIASLVLAGHYIHMPHTAVRTFKHSLSVGYSTMDLLATFFFCHVAYKNIVHKCKAINITCEHDLRKMILKSCMVGAFFISVIYTGFMFSAARHAVALQNVATPALINRLSDLTLGSFGSLFVGICVSLACIATATALAVVSTNFFYRTLFQRKVPRFLCLLVVLVVMYAMSLLGFDYIMKLALPILEYLYPALIVLCVVNICRKLHSRVKSARD